MNKIEELEKLLEKDLLVELEETIKDLNKFLSKNSNNKDAKSELENLSDLQEDFKSVLKDIKDNKLSEDEAKEILEELDAMRIDEDDL
ncbi:MAG: hypothetical protein HRT40_07460 [Campylobacteraceae bacterium]|nr:hypothetical protein [Campylobacteraceae bacterium]